MKPTNTILHFIANSKRSSIIAVLSGGFAFLGLFFGVIYWRAGLTSTSSIIDNMYFSFMMQTCLGFEQIYPVNVYGKALTLIQFTIGMLWIAFIPSVILVRLVSPTKEVFLIAEHMVFYPEIRSFRIRYANTSKLDAIDLSFDLRARFPVEDQDHRFQK